MTGDRMTPAERAAAERRARIRAQVAESRRRQGLPPTITDPTFREQLAAKVADGLVRQKGGVEDQDQEQEHDGGDRQP